MLSNPTILFVNPSLGTKSFTRADVLRSCLSLGALAGAVLNRRFVGRFASRAEGSFASMGLDDLPVFKAEVVQLSLREGRSVETCLRPFIEKCTPFMICVTATSSQLREAYDVAECAARLAPECLRVIGGPHVSVLPTDVLRRSKYQVACIGEGTETLVELALRCAVMGPSEFSEVRGIAYKNETGEVRLSQPRQHLFELDDYPFPSESLPLFLGDLRDARKNGRDIVYVLAGLGCPFHCSFCAQRAIHRGRIRERSAQSLFEEIEALWARGFRRFALVQETFFVRKDRADRFAQLIQRSGLSIEWTAEARADQLDRESLARYRSAGLRMVQIGLESGDQGLLDDIGKSIQLEKAKDVIGWCRDLKIITAVYLLVGLPGQDWQSILRTAHFLRENMPYNPGTMHCSVAIAIPYPGTALAEERTVRIVEPGSMGWDWPARNPEVQVSETGEFIGEGPTETDDMSRREIFEAMLYLDDFLHFSLHALYDRSLDDQGRARSSDFAKRMFTMIERRTIRDLIVRAQADLTPEKRESAYREILMLDAGAEEQLARVTAGAECHPCVSARFLTRISFENGYHTMKRLSVANRIRLMAFLSESLESGKAAFERVRFALDSEEAGRALNKTLGEPAGLQGLELVVGKDGVLIISTRRSFV